MIRFWLATLIALLPAVAAGQTITWNIDPGHSAAQFSVRHMVVANVRGEFDGPKGTFTFDPKDVAGTLEGRRLDRHQKHQHTQCRSRQGPPERDVFRRRQVSANHVQVEARRSGRPGQFKLVGDLTMHGVTKEVTLDVEGPTPEIKDIWGERALAPPRRRRSIGGIRAPLQPRARGRRRGRRRRNQHHDRSRSDSQVTSERRTA